MPNPAKKIKTLKSLAENLFDHLSCCDLCPRNCRINRTLGESGYCGATDKISVYSNFLHQGEEPAISGTKGSGTIFFSGCNLKCVYCQNYKFSHLSAGKDVTIEELSQIMLNLEKQGAHNINLVTPTHYLPQILKAAEIAISQGLFLPMVYNTSGFEKKEIIDLLDDVVDVYLADMKYSEGQIAEKFSKAFAYPQNNCDSIKVMYEQKKDRFSWQGSLLSQGLIIRHLVLPGHLANSFEILSWIKDNCPKALVSTMFQYQPYFNAQKYPEINRRVSFAEYQEVKSFVEGLELEGWIQEYDSDEGLAGVYF
ncbi:MAG: radical SAM protein [Candidatus Omnitrophica bacterium]|nr:radical SAM protein [Candidatus Omnitrophota bacterium]